MIFLIYLKLKTNELLCFRKSERYIETKWMNRYFSLKFLIFSKIIFLKRQENNWISFPFFIFHFSFLFKIRQIKCCIWHYVINNTKCLKKTRKKNLKIKLKSKCSKNKRSIFKSANFSKNIRFLVFSSFEILFLAF